MLPTWFLTDFRKTKINRKKWNVNEADIQFEWSTLLIEILVVMVPVAICFFAIFFFIVFVQLMDIRHRIFSMEFLNIQGHAQKTATFIYNGKITRSLLSHLEEVNFFCSFFCFVQAVKISSWPQAVSSKLHMVILKTRYLNMTCVCAEISMLRGARTRIMLVQRARLT